LPAITPADFVRGPQDASVTLLLYCDFQSVQCEIFNRVLDQLQKNHPGDLKVVLRPFPVPASVVAALDKSQISVQAALAAGKQGKFWEMRDLLHTKYMDWAALSMNQFKNWVIDQTAAYQLDQNKYKEDLNSSETQAQARSMYESAIQLGITNIPTVFINGSLQQRAALSYEGLDSTIGLTALGAKQFKTCPPFNIDPTKQYSATIHTEKGDLLIQLFAERAPLAVNSFVFLARNGWFDGVTFHRVIPGFMAQAGDPSGTGSGGPGYVFNNEIYTDLLFDKPGVVAMANSGPDTNGSQFFITYGPEPKLDGAYTIFGQIIKGLDVLESLTPRDPQQSPNLNPGDKILSVTIEEK
jgi:cyclophilin family peptidyl-prolyl cis-trans isomerase/protein-disulfide isomerase